MPPVDVFSEAQGLQRRRALLQALQQRSASPQIQGTPGQGIAQLLAALGTSYVANQGLNRLDQQEAGNQARYQEGLAGELERFMRTSQGTPNEMLPPDVMGPPQLGMEADPKAAVLAAMTSRYPEMQEIGKAMLPGLAQPPEKPLVVNGQVIDPKTLQPLKDFRTRFDGGLIPLPGADGRVDLYQRDDTGRLHKADPSSRVTATSSSSSVIPKVEGQLAGGVADLVVEDLKTARKDAVRAYKALSQVSQMEENDKQGVFSGPTANLAIFLSGLGETLGLRVDKNRLANSEGFQREFAKQVADVMLDGSIGRSMTDPDRKRFEETLPGLAQSPQGRAQIYAMIRAEAESSIKRHTSFMEQLRESDELKKYIPLLQLNTVDRFPSPGVPPPAKETIPGASSSSGPVKYRVRGGG